MKIGKIPENVLKRSILKQLKTKRKEVLSGAGIGEDCAILSFGENDLMAVTTDPVIGEGAAAAGYAVHTAVNNVAASGAEPVAVMTAMLLPGAIQESDIKLLAAQMESECKALNIQLAGGHTEVTNAVNKPIFTVTGIGKLKEQDRVAVRKVKPGQDIVISKWIGLWGTASIAEQKEAELGTKYPVRLIKEAKEFGRFLSVVPEAATAIKSGVCAMHDVTEGGIFGALWEVAEGAGVGLEIDLKKIPVRQETIEVCEFFEINPYELNSGGCLLMVADNGYDLVKALEAKGIPAVVAGKTTDSNDRIVMNEDERRFLEPPKPGECHKVL